MGLFSGINKAKMRNQSDWAGPGHYYCRIDKVKVDQNRKKETAFFVEMTVLHCLASETKINAEGQEVTIPPHKNGAAITQSIWEKHVDTFLPNVKAFVSSTLGCKPEEVDEAAVDRIVATEASTIDGVEHPAQPLSGTVIEYKGRMIKTKAGRDFTEISYRGEVPATTLQAVLSDDVKNTYFNGGALLDEMAAWEAEQAQA